MRNVSHSRAIAAFLLAALCLTLTAGALAAGEKNIDNLPVGTTEGYRTGAEWFGDDMKYDVTDEEACWELLMRPITVLDVSEKETVYPLDAPGGKKVLNEWQGGFINGQLSAVHVLGPDEDGYTLIEGMDYYNRIISGYVKTSLLKERTPNQTYGLIIDKLTQRLYVYIEGKLWSSCAVSTGEPNKTQPYNETSAGEFMIGSWVGGFGDDGGMYCEMAIRYNGGDMIHQVPYVTLADGSKRFTKFEELLGQRASHGCVRVARIPNEEGLSIKWLWDNLKKGTKVLVWDDHGRALPYPDDSLELFYNPDGGSYYHSSATCGSVKAKYLPLTAFPYSELDSGAYAKLKPCPSCSPVRRKAIIDEQNAARGAATGQEAEATASPEPTETVAAPQESPAPSEGVTIVIRDPK